MSAYLEKKKKKLKAERDFKTVIFFHKSFTVFFKNSQLCRSPNFHRYSIFYGQPGFLRTEKKIHFRLYVLFMPQNIISYKYLFSCLYETVSSYSPEVWMRLWTLYTDLYKRRNSIRIILTILLQQWDLKSRHLTTSASCVLILQCKTNKKTSKPDTFIHILLLQIPPLRFQMHSGLIHSWFRFMSWI